MRENGEKIFLFSIEFFFRVFLFVRVTVAAAAALRPARARVPSVGRALITPCWALLLHRPGAHALLRLRRFIVRDISFFYNIYGFFDNNLPRL